MEWKKIKQFVGAKKITELSSILGIGYDSLQKSIKGGRVLSSQHRLKMLRFLTPKFKSADAAISWLEDEINFFGIALQQEKEEKHFIQTIFSYQKILARLETPSYYISRPADEKVVSKILAIGAKYRGVVVTGIGGAGKTTTVKASVRQALFETDFNLRYDDVLWLNCENKGTNQILISLAAEYGVDCQQPIKNIEFFTRKTLQNKAVLLVLDGIDDLEYIRPLLDLVSHKSKVVVSSRSVPGKVFLSELGLSHHKRSKGLSFSNIETLIKEITGTPVTKEDQEAIRKLEKKIDGLPLAWVILCSLVVETKASWGNIQKRFSLEILESGTTSAKHNSVRASFQLSYDALHHRYKSAGVLFSLLGLFDSIEISLPLLQAVYDELENDSFEEDLSVLVRYGLIVVRKRGNVRFLSMHSLVSHYTRGFADEFLVSDLVYRTIRVGGRIFGIFTQNQEEKDKLDDDFLFASDVLFTSPASKPLDAVQVLAFFSRESMIVFLPEITIPKSRRQTLQGSNEQRPNSKDITLNCFALYVSHKGFDAFDVQLYNDVFSWSAGKVCLRCGSVFRVKKRFEESISFLGLSISESDVSAVKEAFDLFFYEKYPILNRFSKEIAFLKKVHFCIDLS